MGRLLVRAWRFRGPVYLHQEETAGSVQLLNDVEPRDSRFLKDVKQS